MVEPCFKISPTNSILWTYSYTTLYLFAGYQVLYFDNLLPSCGGYQYSILGTHPTPCTLRFNSVLNQGNIVSTIGSTNWNYPATELNIKVVSFPEHTGQLLY